MEALGNGFRRGHRAGAERDAEWRARARTSSGGPGRDAVHAADRWHAADRDHPGYDPTPARDAGIPTAEQPLAREMLYLADEVFLTGTASEVTPVRSVDRIKVGSGKPGLISRGNCSVSGISTLRFESGKIGTAGSRTCVRRLPRPRSNNHARSSEISAKSNGRAQRSGGDRVWCGGRRICCQSHQAVAPDDHGSSGHGAGGDRFRSIAATRERDRRWHRRAAVGNTRSRWPRSFAARSGCR